MRIRATKRLMGLPLAAAAIWSTCHLLSPVRWPKPHEFRRLANRVAHAAGASVGERCTINTYADDGATSAGLVALHDQIYVELCASLAPEPATYYSECGDCPTQETIWQYDGFFVRLYATSALECDAIALDVRPGAYTEFRDLRNADPWTAFRRIEFESPAKFFYPDRGSWL